MLAMLKESLQELSKKYPIEKVYLFGSRAEGNYTADSDVDLIIEFSSSISLLTISAIKIDLEEMLNLSVDIIHGPLRETALIKPGKVVKVYAA